VSELATVLWIRKKLVAQQANVLGDRGKGESMDGRRLWSVVFPNAESKSIYDCESENPNSKPTQQEFT